jgi:hypothetical protein
MFSFLFQPFRVSSLYLLFGGFCDGRLSEKIYGGRAFVMMQAVEPSLGSKRVVEGRPSPCALCLGPPKPSKIIGRNGSNAVFSSIYTSHYPIP